MKSSLAVKLFTVLLIVFLGGTMLAQQQTGELMFKVVDPTGAVVAGAEITLTGSSLIKPTQATTDATGVFRASSLPPGIYKATVKRQGFSTSVRDNIKVEVGRTYPIEIALSMGSVNETVEVAAGSVQIDTVKSESSEVYGGDKLATLPGQRDFADFVKFIPSVNNESLNAGISVDGASGAENVFFVDGVDTSNFYGGTNNQGVRPEIVQEMQVKSGGYEAEFGGAMGGVISVVTKSGGPAYHGQVYYYYNGSKLESADRPTLELVSDSKAELRDYAKDNYNRNEFGVSLGGPIVKDKAWFFANINPTYENTERSALLDNGLGGVFTRHETWRSGLLKVDVQPWQKIRFGASYTQDTYRWKGGLPDKRGTDSGTFQWSKDGYKYPSYTFQGSMTATLSPKFVIDSRYGFNGTDTIQMLGPSGPTYRYLSSNDLIGFCFAKNADGECIDAAPGYKPVAWENQDPNTTGYATAQNYQKKLNWGTTASWSFNALGQHNFKFGYNWNRWMWEVINAHPYDYVRPRFGNSWKTLDGVVQHSACVGPDGNTYDPCGYVEVRSPFGDIAKIHTDHNAFFFQDSWTIARHLTINPGIRFEKEEIPSFSTAAGFTDAPLKWGFKDKIAPRFGAAYDLFGNGKAKIFGSWGWFYDAMKLGMAEGSFGGFKWHTQYYLMNQAFVDSLQDPKNYLPPIGGAHDPSGFTTGCTGNVTGGAVDCSGVSNMLGMQFLEDRDYRMPSFDSLDPNTKAMRMTNMTLGSEIELKKNYIFSGTFVHKQLDRTIEDVGVLTPLGESFYITNPGFGYSVSKFVEGGMPATPKAKRNYNALEFRLRKPFSNNWTGDFSYTYSRLRGNYSGLASSDEDWGLVDTTTGRIEGRNDPNVERYFDFWYLSYDASGKLIDGPLNTDRPHQMKFSGQYQLPHKLPAIGGFFQALSGTPITNAVVFDSAEMYVKNRMDGGRTPFFTQTDMYLVQTFKPFKDESKSIQFNVNIVNLFNQKTVTRKYRLANRGSADLPVGMNGDLLDPAVVQNFLKSGFDWQAAVAASGDSTPDPRFGMNQTFQGPTSVRFGVKFNF